MSYDELRKDHDAVLFGSECAGQVLPTQYIDRMKSFLDSMKKEYKGAKKEEKTDEQDSDPIQAELFAKLCKWAIKDGDVFLLAWLVVEWNLMARSVSICNMGIHYMTECAFSSYFSEQCGETL